MPTQSVIVYNSPLQALFWTNVLNGNIFWGLLYAVFVVVVFVYAHKFAKKFKSLNATWVGIGASVVATIGLHFVLKSL